MGQTKLFLLNLITFMSELIYHYIHHVRDDGEMLILSNALDHFDHLFPDLLKLDAVYDVESLRKG